MGAGQERTGKERGLWINLKAAPTGLAGIGREGEGMRLGGQGVGGRWGRTPRRGLRHQPKQGRQRRRQPGVGTISCQSGDQLDLYVQRRSGDNPDRVYVLSVVWNLAADPKMYTDLPRARGARTP